MRTSHMLPTLPALCSVLNLRRALRVAFAPVVGMALLTACEGEADPTGPGGQIREPAINEVITSAPLNASSNDTLVYFSFNTGTLVSRTADWDLALRRYEVRLNSPANGGTKNVLGYALANNQNATNAEVLAFTRAGTLAAFDALRDAQIPADSQFVTDRLANSPQAHIVLGGIPVANAAQFWKVRLSNGQFAVMRNARIKFTGFVTDTIYIESRLQTGSTLGPVQTVAVAPGGTTRAISLTTNAVVTPNGCNWDVQFNPDQRQLAITVNTACNVGTFPGTASPTFAAATSASDAPQYAAYLSQLVGPIPNSILDTKAPFRYDLTGQQRLHPAFNTYFAKIDTRVWKFQVIDYYSNTGVAGYPTIRYSRIR
ncbi:HmuY family protein [Gemmatimonas phototrophica]|nr:HmuY family protein [Gemmatimonas phototrophica]